MNAASTYFKLRAMAATPLDVYLGFFRRATTPAMADKDQHAFEQWKLRVASDLAIERERLKVEIASTQLAALVRSDFASMDHDGMAETALSLAESLLTKLEGAKS